MESELLKLDYPLRPLSQEDIDRLLLLMRPLTKALEN